MSRCNIGGALVSTRSGERALPLMPHHTSPTLLASALGTSRGVIMKRFVGAIMIVAAAVSPAVAEEGEHLESLRVVQVGPIGLPALRVDLVILGDGYVAEDFRPQGKWEIDSARLAKNFFEKLPFKTLRHLFNVHLVEVRSQDRGADSSPGSDEKRTAFDSTYGFTGIDRLLVCQDQQAVLKAARNAPALDMILVLVNDSRDGGSGGEEDDIPLSTCSTEPTAYETAIHELGHSFANLADEYVDEAIADQYPLPQDGDFSQANVTLVKLVDTSTPARLMETLKWAHFLEEPGAAKKYGKGYYEGAYYRKRGIFRPAVACAMGSQGGTGGFCFVCLAEMTRAIHRTSGRAPGGGVFPEEVPRLKGRLRRPRFSYSQGLFGKALAELEKVERAGKLTDDETKGTGALRKAIETSFNAERSRIAEARDAGRFVEVSERLELLRISFDSTPLEAKVDEMEKAMTSGQSFKKEVDAERELLGLQWTGKALPAAGPERQAWKKRIQGFVHKFEGTRAAELAKKSL